MALFGSPAISNIEDTLLPNLETRANQIRDEINSIVAQSPQVESLPLHPAYKEALAAHNSLIRSIKSLRGVVLHNDDDYRT